MVASYLLILAAFIVGVVYGTAKAEGGEQMDNGTKGEKRRTR
jgi:hypothetical protein